MSRGGSARGSQSVVPANVLIPPVISPVMAPPPNPPKERKPYTITKQRENWTEEEHQKFLEALKLYERDWKKIESYIGTKSVVQIRSHAQKFFLKVQKNGTGEHVPPPRPKRKSSQPYPQKTGQTQLTDQQRLAQEQAEQEQLMQAQKLLNDYMTAAAAQTAQATGEPVRGPDFHRIYAFLGSLFDPAQSMQDVVGALQGMSMVDRETAHVLMHNLSVNLSNDQIRHNVVAHLSFHQQTIAMNQQILAGQPVTITPSVAPQNSPSTSSSSSGALPASSPAPSPAPSPSQTVMGPPPPPGAAASSVSGAAATVVQLSPAAAGSSVAARPGAVTTLQTHIRSVQVPPGGGRPAPPPAMPPVSPVPSAPAVGTVRAIAAGASPVGAVPANPPPSGPPRVGATLSPPVPGPVQGAVLLRPGPLPPVPAVTPAVPYGPLPASLSPAASPSATQPAIPGAAPAAVVLPARLLGAPAAAEARTAGAVPAPVPAMVPATTLAAGHPGGVAMGAVKAEPMAGAVKAEVPHNQQAAAGAPTILKVEHARPTEADRSEKSEPP